MTPEERWRQAAPLLVDWYGKNERALPWRQDPSPYHVWLSETMLQQTRIETVIPYYERFIRELPDIQSLARVPDDRLMKLWEGLGYYSRARNLKKAADAVMENFGGFLPSSLELLKSLPGIGEYTAGAVASVAFGLPEPAVDGNVLRVVMRLWASEQDIAQPAVKKQVADLLRKGYPQGKAASALTQGIMELGQTICIPNGMPRCDSCPLKELCLAAKQSDASRYPVKSPKKQRTIEQKTVFLLSCQGRYAVCRREEKGLLAGMWQFPNVQSFLTPRQAQEVLQELATFPQNIAPLGEARHIFTHREWHMTGYEASCEKCAEAFCWKTPEQIRTECAIPSAFRFFLQHLPDDKK